MHYWTSPGREQQTPSSHRTKKPRFRIAPAPTLGVPPVSSRSSWFRPALAFALVLILFGSGVLVGRSHNSRVSRTPPENLGATFEPFWETWNLVEKHYVGRNITGRHCSTAWEIWNTRISKPRRNSSIM